MVAEISECHGKRHLMHIYTKRIRIPDEKEKLKRNQAEERIQAKLENLGKTPSTYDTKVFCAYERLKQAAKSNHPHKCAT